MSDMTNVSQRESLLRLCIQARLRAPASNLDVGWMFTALSAAGAFTSPVMFAAACAALEDVDPATAPDGVVTKMVIFNRLIAGE